VFHDIEAVDGQLRSSVIDGLTIDPATLFAGID